MKLSLVIPCTHRDVVLVPDLLEAYANGTELPDQVIVSVSNAHMADGAVLERIATIGIARFPEILILKHHRRMFHGPNRQAASERAIHELICYQDADDTPHPQRIQIVKRLFEQYDIMHLNHTYCLAGTQFHQVQGALQFSVWYQSAIAAGCFPQGLLRDCAQAQPYYGAFTERPVHAGQPVIRREVLEKVRWKDWGELAFGIAEDYEFDMECVYFWRKSMIVDIPLIRYTPFAGRETPEEILGLVPDGASPPAPPPAPQS
ncbi:glycosyltransferase [Azospirillum sp. CT11-132]|uniref:glycosyltransferase n=1 Tax=Azospirillum sp. CT11-132 TaxID=3396317 RepID=UPI0039A50044